MSGHSENKYLQSLLNNLIETHETETNYTPLEVPLDIKQISKDDIRTLLIFLKESRKRLFVFKIDGDEQNTNLLTLAAYHSILNQTATTILQSTSSKPTINPLKLALSHPNSKVRSGIQIQKGFILPKPPVIKDTKQQELVKKITTPDLKLIEINFPKLPILVKQLKLLGIKNIQDTASKKILKYSYAFTDGLIPENMPKGFYIDHEKQALCYTKTPTKLPTALAPILKKQEQLPHPTLEQAQELLLSTVSIKTLTNLLNDSNQPDQIKALISVMESNSTEISGFINGLKTKELEFIIPFLSKLYIHGGETHTSLIVRLLQTCLNKKINIEFLKDAEAQNALLSPRGLKNLQKLLLLTGEQKEWWNSLSLAHLNNKDHHFDFNNFFEAYTQIFLPRISDLKLTLPSPCPIHHDGHLLTTLNRVLDVIEYSKNHQEQCSSLLGELDWGATGVHYALLEAPNNVRMQQVASCMKLEKIEQPEDLNTNPELIYNKLIENKSFKLQPWLFRFIGQHWKKGLRLTEIQTQLEEIENLPTWSIAQKNLLTFILTCSFSDESEINFEQWKNTLNHCIDLLKTLNEQDRTDLLEDLSRCFKFQPVPSLNQINQILNQCIDLKSAFPDKNFKKELLTPLFNCLEKEGIELIYTIKERSHKIDPESELVEINNLTTLLETHRDNLQPVIIKLLAKLNESNLIQSNIEDLLNAIRQLGNEKGVIYCDALLNALSQINISKSQSLPNIKDIQKCIIALTNSEEVIPESYKNTEKQEEWIKNTIINKNLLPGCVIGKGDISKLDDLIVEALVDAVKKRGSVLKIDSLKKMLEEHLQNVLVPEQLRIQLNKDLMPLFDLFNELIDLLKTPNPKFEEVINKLAYFEKKVPVLLKATYSVSLIGSSTGEFILSLLLTGKKKANDTITGSVFATILSKLHGVIVNKIKEFFSDQKNKNVIQDLDVNTILSWMSTFNVRHSPIFLFKEELVQKKVLPALKKTLHLLNTQDINFENNILDAAAELAENEPSDKSLSLYKTKIATIVAYLNLLIEIKDIAPSQFHAITKQLHTGALTRIDFKQKQCLLDKLKAKPESLELYLKLLGQALDEKLDADAKDIDRTIEGLVTLLELTDLESETKTMFFKLSVAHNLNNTTPFPLAALSEFKKSNLKEETKSPIIKQIIQLLSHMNNSDSAELIKKLVYETKSILSKNEDQASLCIEFLKLISPRDLGKNISAYADILAHLASINNDINKEQLTRILLCLASNKKDDSVSLPLLLEITKSLESRQKNYLEILNLFTTPPYPTAQTLNSALLDPGSEKLKNYCSNFDANPFAKAGEKRPLAKQFSMDRVQDALASLKDLTHELSLPYTLQVKLAKQLTYIETLGFTNPLNPNDYKELNKLTALTRLQLKERASTLLDQLRSKKFNQNDLELIQLELLANLREIYFRTTGLFPNTTQMLMLLISLHSPSNNLLMSIKTGEGKSLITPMLAVIQWAQGGTVDVCTANRILLSRDYENSCKPFFNFLGIKSALIQSTSRPEEYQLNGINCSTLEDMSLFRLSAKEEKQERHTQNGQPIHLVLDECDDALLDQTTLYKLVAENSDSITNQSNNAQWIYPLACQFINLPSFQNTDSSKGKVWDEEEDLEQFRLYLNKQINEQYNGSAEKQNYLMTVNNTQLRQWIDASCKAAKLVENKHFIVQHVKEKDETGTEVTKKIVCVPLIHSTPKNGCIFNDGIQQALQARLKLMPERKEQAHFFVINPDPPVLASQSARGLIGLYQKTKGRLLGISGTPGDPVELQYLSTLLGTQTIGVDPYAGDKRINHSPTFTFSRNETIKEIHNAIDKIKRPITDATMVIDKTIENLENYDEINTHNEQTRIALAKWRHTQTQPILIICKNFVEAHKLGQNFAKYKEEGFKIQVVTGKESPEELDRIVKQAGRENTITIGTTMLARGIDINPGDHPQGLCVIQNNIESKRMNTQIAGRAARNGKPGQWIPIYQVKSPQGWWNRILCFIFPFYRNYMSNQAVETLQSQIKLQASVDRLYTQAIDDAQQILMQQIEAWENLLLELYPNDPKIQFDLYQWRENLLSELTHYQESNISNQTLELSITQFKRSICRVWEIYKEDKWLTKANKANTINIQQSLKLNYLKQINLSNELNVQTGLQQGNTVFKEGTKALIHQSIETTIRDKAGVVLEYTKPETEEQVNDLKLAQSRQILPILIGNLCLLSPEAMKIFIQQYNNQKSSFLPEMLNSMVNKFIDRKNKFLFKVEDKNQIVQTIVKNYQEQLNSAQPDTIQKLIKQFKELLISHIQELKHESLVDQFKMQGLVLTFGTLYEHSGLTEDIDKISSLQLSYNQEIMKKLSNHLLKELAWVKESPQPLHAILERRIAVKSAYIIYALADALNKAPNDATKIHNLYAGLKRERLQLKDVYLFSIGHSSPRNVINTALDAIDSLNVAPYCDQEFKNSCHDTVLAEYHLHQFRSYLDKISPPVNNRNNHTWKHLKNALIAISNKHQKGKTHLIQELYEAIERFNSYETYKTYKSKLDLLKMHLNKSLMELNHSDGLKSDSQESLFAQKAKDLAQHFNVNEQQIHIQSGCNGVERYIEVQIKDLAPKKGFKTYHSLFLEKNMKNEEINLQNIKNKIETNRKSLEELSDSNAYESLPVPYKAEFEKLFRLKELLQQNWSDDLKTIDLPESIKLMLEKIHQLKKLNWIIQPVDLSYLTKTLGLKTDENFLKLLNLQSSLCEKIKEHQITMSKLHEQIINEQLKLTLEKEKQSNLNQQLNTNNGIFEKFSINVQIRYNNYIISPIETEISKLEQSMKEFRLTDTEYKNELVKINQLIENKREDFISILEKEAKNELNIQIHNTSRELVNKIEMDLKGAETTLINQKKAELTKSQYQTHRFFSVRELLKFEATLNNEEQNIPKNQLAEDNDSEFENVFCKEAANLLSIF